MKKRIKIAKKIKNLRRHWFPGTALYELNESVEVVAMGFLTDTKYVIVAVSPEALDHGQKETTIFAANKTGTLFGGFWEKGSVDRFFCFQIKPWTCRISPMSYYR